MRPWTNFASNNQVSHASECANPRVNFPFLGVDLKGELQYKILDTRCFGSNV